MSQDEDSNLNSVLDALRVLDTSFESEGAVTHFLKFEVKSDECVLSGNQAGLIHTARTALEIAIKNSEGTHQTLDEAGMLDACDKPLTLALVADPWQS